MVGSIKKTMMIIISIAYKWSKLYNNTPADLLEHAQLYKNSYIFGATTADL